MTVKAMPEKPSYIASVTGIDMGLSHFLINLTVGNRRTLAISSRASRNLRRKQKRCLASRKAVPIAGRRGQLAAVYERITHARADFQHKLSRTIVDENQAAICVETLKAANMMKNHNWPAPSAMAGWAGFITKLEYKAAAAGKHLVKIDQWFASSKTCHCCGHKMPEMPFAQALAMPS